MTLYVGNKKIADTGVYGVYYEDQAIKSIYYGSELVYEYITYAPGQKLIESTGPGSYSFTPIVNCVVSLILVAGGGGGATHQGGSRTGGQGALITGQTTVIKDTIYSVTVGEGGTYAYSTNINVGSQGGTGGSSIAFGNTANGGTGGHAHTGWWATSYYDGSPGSGTVVDGFTLTTGTATTASIWGSYGGGGQTTVGQDGYCEVSVVSVIK